MTKKMFNILATGFSTTWSIIIGSFITIVYTGIVSTSKITLSMKTDYYLPEVSSMKYCCLRVFRKEYFRLVTN